MNGSSGRSSSSSAEDPGVAIELPGPQRLVDIARVPHDQVGPADRDPGPPQRRQDLLVDAVGPANILAERKQPDVIDDRLAAAAVGAGVARAAHHVRGGSRMGGTAYREGEAPSEPHSLRMPAACEPIPAGMQAGRRASVFALPGRWRTAEAGQQRDQLLPLAARPRRRHRARRRNRRSPAPALRSAPRRSRRPRRNRTPAPRTSGRSRPCGPCCRYRRRRSRRRVPATDSKQCGRLFSSSRTIMVRLTLGRPT